MNSGSGTWSFVIVAVWFAVGAYSVLAAFRHR